MYQNELKLLSEARADTLRLTADVCQALSEFAPVKSKWPVGEVLDHLLLADQLHRGVFTDSIEIKKEGKPAVVSGGFARGNTAIAYIPSLNYRGMRHRHPLMGDTNCLELLGSLLYPKAA